ncbi:uncharacterized protein M6B38_205490 [Iris pallida]|uniref:Uncharacterized protein n=1 Tax=Iris pallida TaxID=29817 RepID=A0AAX6E7X5_IRIPA|nr:uncharacterized protein M6B38_205490 [Iris pallida]
MGANCCVAARGKPSPQRISCDVPNYRNVRHSPSWSFRWDNRTHIEDIMDNPSRFSLQNSANVSSEIKSTQIPKLKAFRMGGVHRTLSTYPNLESHQVQLHLLEAPNLLLQIDLLEAVHLLMRKGAILNHQLRQVLQIQSHLFLFHLLHLPHRSKQQVLQHTGVALFHLTQAHRKRQSVLLAINYQGRSLIAESRLSSL